MSKKITFSLLFMSLVACHVLTAQSPQGTWIRNENPSSGIKEKAGIWARNYSVFTLSLSDLKEQLADAPLVPDLSIKKGSIVFSLPMPDGKFSTFSLIESPVMEKPLAQAYPQIRTYAGQGVEDPTATLRCDVTVFGFHAMVLSANGTVFVDPIDRFTTDIYVSYYKKDALPQDFSQECLLDHADEEFSDGGKQQIAGELRTYRLALACTGEYAAYHGGTMVGALSGMVTTINRVNGVYERELGIHMNLIANDTLLIYTNASSDPYSNNNGGTMLTQNQNNITSLIGADNYDIGHVFSTGGGGIAGLGVICNNNSKARGVTGLNTPIGDAFDIDYVAHEMGHQFGANHTFNATAGSCGGGTRVSSAAYEPGSASTILGYAGICSGQDLQSHSDDYFHTKSFDEIVFYTHYGTGNTCPLVTTDSNNAPVLTVPGSFNIPLNTPFRLTASATDPDGNAVTYCWEEYDLGPAGNWNAPSGNAPIFRSFNPAVSGTRLFPKLVNILNNNTTIGEIKPSYARTLNFRCIVRDNQLSGAGITYNTSTVKVNVIATPGPFAILKPNTNYITWVTNTLDSVTWSVNSTNLAPINATTVNVLLSLDGGYTWPITLGAGVPNSGSYTFMVPDTTTFTARVMVEGSNNIFFDINDKNFVLSESAGIEQQKESSQVLIYPNPSTENFTMLVDNADRGTLVVRLYDISGKIVHQQAFLKAGQQFRSEINVESLTPGIYTMQIMSTNSLITKKIVKK